MTGFSEKTQKDNEMPSVGKKSFGYSKSGQKKAKAYAKKTGKTVKKKKVGK